MTYIKRSLHFTPAEEAVLTTILYSDIFSFPITKNELWKFLITKKKISRDAFNNSLKSLKKNISYKNGYFCLRNRDGIINKRLENVSEIERKLQKAHLVSKKLSSISSILFIGITGGLAVGDVTSHDDIDLVIITKKNTLFLTRFLILLMLETMGLRRSRNQINSADTICVNLLFDETAVEWFTEKKDVYTAREIAQILPLFERNGMYRKFLSANKWINNFLPNIAYSDIIFEKKSNNIRLQSITNVISTSFFEAQLRFLQMRWMKLHQTSETVSNHVSAFHPIDYRVKALNQLRLKMHQLGLLTKF
jgi:hypothetical protein